MKRVTALLLALATSASATGFLEPPLTVYGKVTTNIGGGFQLYTGELTWIFTPPGDTPPPLTVTTGLEPVAGGRYSYRLRVPLEHLTSPDPDASADRLATTVSETTYAVTVTVNGEDATLATPDGTPLPTELTFAELRRATFLNIDLQLAGGGGDDADGDGLPDIYETKPELAGILDPTDPTDAFADPDGDGVPTLVEYFDGTDPSCYEWTRWLASNNLTGDLAAFDADPDLDGLTNGFEYAFDGDPRTPDRDAVLSKLDLSTGTAGTLYTAILPGTRHCGVDYLVELSADLDTWSPALTSPTLTLTESPTLITFEEDSTTRSYVRVRVTSK